MKQKKLHMIGNAHIDPVWLWQWQEGFQEVKATFRSVLDRMHEYDDFIFTCSSAAFYEWVELNDPTMFQEIVERAAEGRWQIVGGWWIQPDCNIPSGESFVRQGLYGQRYFREKFQTIAHCGYNVDSFGHSGMLPQILSKSGMDSYIFMRPMPLEKGLPARLFWWESDDGTRVLSFRIPYEYCTWGKELHDHITRCAEEIQAPVNELMCFYGVGNHGGGPTRENIDSIHQLSEKKELPELVMSSPEAYFTSIRKRGVTLPVYHGDLQHHASGCYAAHSGIKQWNRQAENRLALAEKFSALAERLTGQPYPRDFGRAWKNVLFNQFHDILAGTSLKEAYDDARNMYGEAVSIADRNANYALQSLSWAIDIEENSSMKPLVVFNPHSWGGKMPVEIECGRCLETDILVDETGKQVPFQLIQSHAAANGRTRICFTADLPPLGYRVYKMLVPDDSQKNMDQKNMEKREKISFPAVVADDNFMENDWLAVHFDPVTGCISSIRDKELDFSVVKGLAARPCAVEDKSDTWSHGVFKFSGKGRGGEGFFSLEQIKLLEQGPVRATIAVTSTWGRSRIVQEFSLYRELPRIDVRVTVDWHESFTMLKLLFPVNLEFRKAVSEIPYGHIGRSSNGEEEPMQSWIDFSGQGRGMKKLYGLSLVNDGKYSCAFDMDVMELTVLRSPVYAHHDPMVPDPDRRWQFMDQGLQEFSYVLLPHRGNWQKSAAVQTAAELNQPPVVIKETCHRGSLAQKASYITIDSEAIIMTVLKKAEAGDDLILRCYEAYGEQTTTVISFPQWNGRIETTFGPCEIKTFRISFSQEEDGRIHAVETNLLEWTEGEMPE